MIKIDKDKCISCGLCTNICPSNFLMGQDGKAEVVSQDNNPCVQEAISACPVEAISE